MSTHNGFVTTPLGQAGVFRRFLGKPAMENAFIEIRNRLAAEPLRAISSAETHEILERYGWSIATARPLLADVYRVALRHAAEDGELSDAEQRFLNDLATASCR